LATVTAHQCYRNIQTYQSTSTWQTSGLSPDLLLRYGLLEPNDVLINGHYWRLFTSLMACASWWEALYVYWGWRFLQKVLLHVQLRHKAIPHMHATSFAVPFVSAAVTGQLWSLAWTTTNTWTCAGAAPWGMAGVLCYAGILLPTMRGRLFVGAILAVWLAVIEGPYTSVWGAVGGAVSGWAFAGTHSTNTTTTNTNTRRIPPCVLVAQVCYLSALVLPLLWMALYPSIRVLLLKRDE
jgi:hypothetical protein